MLWLLPLTLWCSSAAAMDVTSMKKIDTIGAWELRNGVDPFTDKVVCVLLNNGNPAYQATLHTFFIRNEARRGRLASYKLRFDDDAPSGVRVVNEVEKKLNALALQLFDIGRLASASRLRLEIVSLSQHGGGGPIVYNVDLNVAGYDQARDSWRKSGCPN
jgi:hypothetical protein